jgi:Cysteine-rich secretory protein family
MGRIVASCRGLARGLGLLAAAVTLVALAPTGAQASSSSGFVADINAARTSRGGHALTVKSDLTAAAQAQAERMADKSELYHNPNLGGSVSHWTMLAENVGYGPDVATIHAAFMASPGHRTNILNPKYTEVGVGVVVRDHVMWVAEVFRRPVGASSGSGSGSGTTPKKSSAKASSSSASPKTHAPVSAKPKAPKAKPAAKPAAVPVLVVAPTAARADRGSRLADSSTGASGSLASEPSAASGPAPATAHASTEPTGVPAPAEAALALLALVVLGCAARLRLT